MFILAVSSALVQHWFNIGSTCSTPFSTPDSQRAARFGQWPAQVCEPEGDKGHCRNALGDPCKKTIGGTMCASKIYLEDRKTTCKKNWEGKAGTFRKDWDENRKNRWKMVRKWKTNIFAGVIAKTSMDFLAFFIVTNFACNSACWNL